MLTARTLVILGAGASHEINLPLGSGLIGQVAGALDLRFEYGYQRVSGSPEVFEAIKLLDRDPNPYIAAGGRIGDALHSAYSIDAYMDRHREDQHLQVVAKIAIAQRILESERGSPLFVDPSNHGPDDTFPLGNVTDTWFMKFFRRLADRVPRAEVGKLFNNVAFINFNYDRCLEHFLVGAIAKAYHCPIGEAQAVASTAKIYHPYGTIGALPWMPTPGGAPEPVRLNYGASTCSAETLLAASKGIRTFTEQQAQDAQWMGEMKTAIQRAMTVLFLGFSYQEQNMLLMRLKADKSEVQQVFATAVGFSDNATGIIRTRIYESIKTGTTPGNIHVENGMRCGELIDHYALRL